MSTGWKVFVGLGCTGAILAGVAAGMAIVAAIKAKKAAAK